MEPVKRRWGVSEYGRNGVSAFAKVAAPKATRATADRSEKDEI